MESSCVKTSRLNGTISAVRKPDSFPLIDITVVYTVSTMATTSSGVHKKTNIRALTCVLIGNHTSYDIYRSLYDKAGCSGLV